MSRRILVCDANPQMRCALSAILSEAGFAVEATGTTADAHHRARLRPPAGAVAATAPPDGAGVNLCRRLREWSALPLILVSAAADEDEWSAVCRPARITISRLRSRRCCASCPGRSRRPHRPAPAGAPRRPAPMS
jgi:CheY-like chemotaxis protein